jgi:hypothetical protein
MDVRKIELGSDQEVWLARFGSIDLRQWRRELVGHKERTRLWAYVGDQKEDDPDRYDRTNNLARDVYYYWPRHEPRRKRRRRANLAEEAMAANKTPALPTIPGPCCEFTKVDQI